MPVNVRMAVTLARIQKRCLSRASLLNLTFMLIPGWGDFSAAARPHSCGRLFLLVAGGRLLDGGELAPHEQDDEFRARHALRIGGPGGLGHVLGLRETILALHVGKRLVVEPATPAAADGEVAEN